MTDESPNIIPVKDLIVVGYADAFDENTVPARVAPIFQFRDVHRSDECVFPPFRLSGPYVCDGGLGPFSDFEEMVAEGLATKIEPAQDARPAGMLWIDENLEPHYGQQSEENQRLREMADQRLKEAYSHFRTGRFDDALRSARWAAAADEASSHALWLQAAVYRVKVLRGLIEDKVANRAINILREWAQSRPNVSRYDEEVNRLIEDWSASKPEKELPPEAHWQSLLHPAFSSLLAEVRMKLKEQGNKISLLESRVDQLDAQNREYAQHESEDTWT